MSAVILQDEIVHYEVLGRGRPLVFLHGWVGSWRYWIPSMQAASISFRAYAIDLWGFGDTAKIPSRYTIDSQAQLLAEFMDKMGIPKIALVGHGLGSVVALCFARQHPDFVDRVMAIALPFSTASVSPKLRSLPPSELANWLLAKIPAADPARIEAPKADATAITATINEIDGFNWQQLVNEASIPCLFVHGLSDPAVNAPREDEMAGFPDNAHQVLFDQSGHFPMLEENNKFNRLLTDFLALNSGESPRDLQIKEEWKRRIR
jgi:pimeloyl-ACP methyl ester carboxylesterase